MNQGDLADRLLSPANVAIVGLSSDPTKHGGRLLANLRRLGFGGDIWGVNPRRPHIDGVDVFPTVADLPIAPDLVVAAVPASAVESVVMECAGVGAVIVFGAGFAEAGPEGKASQDRLALLAARVGTRLIGPNSGGVIRPAIGLGASFLTCLDRPPEQIRSGPVGLVTQSGGTGSFLHNLAAARGQGLGASVSTGNEADVGLGEALEAVASLEEVRVVLVVLETIRDGRSFVTAVRKAHRLGKRVVACRLGVGETGSRMTVSHTGAIAVPGAVTDGFFRSLGAASAETPAEAFDVASLLAAAEPAAGSRAGIVTHSGGAAILLADLADRLDVDLPPPGEQLRASLEPLLDHGIAANPVDMGGIIGGPGRFAEVVDLVARSGDYDMVLAVSTAHPPAHTAQRVAGLIGLDSPVPVLHLWMAGDQGAAGLEQLRGSGQPVTEEPRAAMRALHALGTVPDSGVELPALTGGLEEWGIPLETGVVAADFDGVVHAAEQIGYPVVLKLEAPGLHHRSELGAVRVDLRGRAEVEEAFGALAAIAADIGAVGAGFRVQRYRPGVEIIVGAIDHEALGPTVTVGMGGVFAEVLRDVVFAPAPVTEDQARRLIDQLRGRPLLDGFRGAPPADVDALAGFVSKVSRAVIGPVREVEINPLIWDGESWVGVDWLVR